MGARHLQPPPGPNQLGPEPGTPGIGAVGLQTVGTGPWADQLGQGATETGL